MFRRHIRGVSILFLIVVAAAALAVSPASLRASEARVDVIVRAEPGQVAGLERRTLKLGGRVTRDLSIIDGFSATVPARAVAVLRRDARVVSVTLDAPVRLFGDPKSNSTWALGYDEVNDKGSLLNVAKVTRAVDSWSAGYTGKGVDVALIDTGVVPVPGLTSGNVVLGPDLSFESQNGDLRNLDTYGHGTHMASVIVGRDRAATAADYSSGTMFTGIAPDARLVSVKVAAYDGAVDVSQVIAAIDWVVQHRNANGLNIRVLNLSFGTDSTQDYRLDPLAYAAEVAMRSGILVVAAVGNDGKKDKTIASPALNPHVLAVGAIDASATHGTSDDVVPAFATKGSSTRGPDVVAPAASVIGLRAPGSFLDTNFTGGRLGDRFFRGSGSSQAAAVVSGLAALLAQRSPTMSSFELKEQLMSYAQPEPSVSSSLAGRGLVDVGAAQLGKPKKTTKLAEFGTGTGLLELARGSARVQLDGLPLVGEQDVMGRPFASGVWAPAALAGTTWTGGAWNGTTWTGTTWTSDQWFGTAWQGTTWTGTTWTGTTWTGTTWTGTTWTGTTWTGTTWTGTTWTGTTWTDAFWAGAGWG